MTPFRALYGQDPPLLLKGTTVPSRVDEVNKLTQQRDELLEDLRSNLLKAQDQMWDHANKRRRQVEYSEGDWVYLKLQPYRMKTLAKKPNEKLRPRFYGPYQILKKIGDVAYKLDLPADCRVHPVFHVSLLKTAIGPNQQPQPLPPLLSETHELEVHPEEVLSTRRTTAGEDEVPIKWQQLPDHENSWELSRDIREAFPHFHLEDKVDLVGGSIVRQQPPIHKVYVRHGKGIPIN